MFHMPMITKSRSPSGTEGRVSGLNVWSCRGGGGFKGEGDAAVEIVKRNEAYDILMYIHSKVALSLSLSTFTGLN